MRAGSLLVGVFAVAVSASPLEDEYNDIFARAGNAATCNFYAAQQIKACPTGKQFCSTFLKNFPPVATTSVGTTAHTTVTISSGISTTSEQPTSTVEYTYNCGPTEKAKRQAPTTAFGSSCNVKEIEKTRIESGCSCNGFTYKGRRPAPTTTKTFSSDSTVIDTTEYIPTSTTTILPTETVTRFHINPTSESVTYQLRLIASATGYQFLVEPFDDNIGAAVFLTHGGYPEDLIVVLPDGSKSTLKGNELGTPHPLMAACSDTDCPSSDRWFQLIGLASLGCNSGPRQVLYARFNHGTSSDLLYNYVCAQDDGTSLYEVGGNYQQNVPPECFGVDLVLYPVASP